MANSSPRTEESHAKSSLILLFAVMMFILGLTIGALAVFSSTSVTNTIIELLAAVAFSGAGIFGVRKELHLTPPQVLNTVAIVGLCLLGGYWAGWVLGGAYRESLSVMG